MISGVRLTQLDHGEPLLGSSYSYDGLYGVEAVEKRLEKLFSTISYFGFNFVIDTINPTEDINGNINLTNNGLYGHIWSFEERMAIYRKYQSAFGFKLVMEVNFHTNINESNWKKYSEFIKSIMLRYNDILYWQIGDEPEKIVNNQYKCNPISYAKLIKSLSSIKLVNNNVQIGGPGILNGLVDFNNDIDDCWLNQAMGDFYEAGNPIYEGFEKNGFLDYIDFFSIHGRQEINELKYDKFPYIIEKLKNKVRLKTTRDINIFSIDQGHTAKANDQVALDVQGYQEIKEILNAYKCGVIGFKNQLIDEFNDKYAWGGYFDPNLEGKGLLYCQVGDNMYKPAATVYQFILNALKEYSYVGPKNKVSELNPNIESITLYNGDPNSSSPAYSPTKSATIIWSDTFRSNRVVLTPHYAREYMVKFGEPISLTQAVDIDFSKHDFVIVYETLEKNIIDIENIDDVIDRKLSYAEKTMVDLMRSLPSSYNTEITDTNYYKLLRSLALEISDAKIELHKVKHNQYLDDVENDYLYKNFGVLVGLSKKNNWDNDKYRRLIKGVTKSLLEGPTYESIVEAIKLFTNFNVKIKELYKDPSLNDTVGGDKTQFLFAIEIEKPLQINSSERDIERDVDYVIDIIKPAHTLRLLIISLVGDENYRQQYENNYGIEFKNSDRLTNFHYEQVIREGIFGWKDGNYEGQIKTAGDSNIQCNSLINGGLFLGPRYALFEELNVEANIDKFDSILKKWEEDLDSLLNWDDSELFKDPDKDEKIEDRDYIDFDISHREHKFGLLVDNLIQFSDRQKINDVLVKYKVFNKHRLGFTSKLDDQDVFGVDFNDLLIKKDYKDSMNVEYIHLDKYDMDDEKNPEIAECSQEAEITFEDYLRERVIVDLDSKKHIKYVKRINKDDYKLRKVYLPRGEFININNKTFNVFINGKLIPKYYYSNIIFTDFLKRVGGIKFNDNCSLEISDVLTIMYDNDQKIYWGDFPFNDSAVGMDIESQQPYQTNKAKSLIDDKVVKAEDNRNCKISFSPTEIYNRNIQDTFSMVQT